jgi:tetratricopeptide (TPR) repeat protein
MSEIENKVQEEEEMPVIEDVPKAESGPIRRDVLPQKDYYKKWDHFTSDELENLDEEEKKEKEESDRLMGKDKAMYSEAHKKDKTTHEALKEAKKIWDRRKEEEIQAKFELIDLENENKVLSSDEIQDKKVIMLKNLNHCNIELPGTLYGIIKVFIEKCVDCTVTVKCKMITSHLEVSHCNNLNLNIEEEEIHTVQVDLCKGMQLQYGKGLFKPDHRIYSAGCLDLNMKIIESDGGEYTSRNDYIQDLAPMVVYTGNTEDDGSKVEVGSGKQKETTTDAVDASDEKSSVAQEKENLPSLVVGSVPVENGENTAEGQAKKNTSQASFSDPRSEEQHFLTKLVPKKGLITEVAIQVGNRWVTRSELELETAREAEVTAREMQENTFRAEREKLCGNQSFSNAEYSQAAVHYTMAIDFANTADSQSTIFPQPVSPLIHQCYSNRAACFLKLGQHERALADADSCIETAPDNFVKGHFRRGMALHALGRYAEALPSLGKALRLENPKAKKSIQQIKEAITFAELKLDM